MRAFVPSAGGSLSLSNDMPVSEAVTGGSGTGVKASRSDHSHKRLTSVTAHSTAANGEATIVFTRTFAAKPGLTLGAEEDADGGALSWKVRSYTTNAQSQITGCVVKFYRTQPLPAVLTLLTALLNFRVDAGTVGVVPFTCIAVERSS